MMYLPTYHNLYINKGFFFIINSVYYDYYFNLYKMFYKQVPMMSYDIVLNYLQIPTRNTY